MKQQNKILLGILSFVPLLLSGLAFALLIRFIFTGFYEHLNYEFDNSAFPEQFFASYIWIMLCIGLGSLIGLALMITYIIFAIKDESASENDKLLWVLLLIFLSFISLPLYWYFRLWKNDKFRFEQKITDRSN